MYLAISNKTFVAFSIYESEEQANVYTEGHPNVTLIKLSHGLVQEIATLYETQRRYEVVAERMKEDKNERTGL